MLHSQHSQFEGPARHGTPPPSASSSCFGSSCAVARVMVYVDALMQESQRKGRGDITSLTATGDPESRPEGPVGGPVRHCTLPVFLRIPADFWRPNVASTEAKLPGDWTSTARARTIRVKDVELMKFAPPVVLVDVPLFPSLFRFFISGRPTSDRSHNGDSLGGQGELPPRCVTADKQYRPRTLNDMQYHTELSARLKSLVRRQLSGLRG